LSLTKTGALIKVVGGSAVFYASKLKFYCYFIRNMKSIRVFEKNQAPYK